MENIVLFPSIRLIIEDWRHVEPNGETWGCYKPLFGSDHIEVNFDLVTYNGVDYLL